MQHRPRRRIPQRDVRPYAPARPSRRVEPMRTHARRRAIRLTAGVIGGIAGTLVLGLGVLLSTGGLFVPALYLDAWDKGYHQHFSDPRLQLVALGLLAPSGHNMQPWRVRLDPADPHAFDVYVDPDRLTPAVDPDARQTMVSVGTFLEYIRVAGGELGWKTTA